jgi:hypothetical protein
VSSDWQIPPPERPPNFFALRRNLGVPLTEASADQGTAYWTIEKWNVRDAVLPVEFAIDSVTL